MSAEITKRARARRSTIGLAAAAGAFLMGAGAVSAVDHFTGRQGANRQGANESGAALTCPGGISRLGHVLNKDASIFPGDPKTKIRFAAIVAKDGYLVEDITVGSHTGTQLDAPAHFIEGGDSVDLLAADELVWPVSVIDVQECMAGPEPDDFQLSSIDVQNALGAGELEENSIVVLVTGFEDKFGTEAHHDPIPGFSGPAASSDELYDATYTALLNDGVVIPDLNNVAGNLKTGDLMIASPVALQNGSAFLVDPLACHGTRAVDAN